MRTHIDECYARVAEAAVEQVNNTRTFATRLQGLYDAADQEIRKINIKVAALERPSGKSISKSSG